MASMSELEVSFINYCDQAFHTYGNMPTVNYLSERFNLHVDKVKALLNDPKIRKAFIARGVDFAHTVDKTAEPTATLSTEQILVANAMLNINDKRSNRQKLEDFNVSTQQFNTWYAQPAFANYMRARAEAMFGAGDADAYLGLLSLVQQNDLGAIKLFMEVRGIYNPKVTHQVDIPSIVIKLIEIIQHRVGNLPEGPEILSQIASDIELLEILPTGSRAGSSPAQTRSAPLSQPSLPAHTLTTEPPSDDLEPLDVDPLSSQQSLFSL